jgi:hypothetical protein
MNSRFNYPTKVKILKDIPFVKVNEVRYLSMAGTLSARLDIVAPGDSFDDVKYFLYVKDMKLLPEFFELINDNKIG